MRRLSCWMGLCVAVALGGCSVGPDYVTPRMATPAKWSTGTGNASAASLKAWWRSFNDPVLDGLIDEAVAGNTDVATAKAKIREARAAQRETAAGLMPSLEGTGSAELTSGGQGLGDVATSTTALVNSTSATGLTAPFQAGLDASWELDVFGGKTRDLEAASDSAEAAEDDLQAALLTLIGDIGSNHIDVRGYQARIALARRTLDSQRKTAQLTRVKFEAGSVSAADAAKADAQAATTASNIPDYETAEARAIHRLSLLTGRDAEALRSRLSDARPIPAPRKALPAGIPADLLRRRPDVRAAERRVAEATAKIGSAEADRYPDLSLSGSLSGSAFRLGDLARASSISSSLGPSIPAPIFDAGNRLAPRDAAEAERDQDLIAWRASVLSAIEDVENALVALGGARKKAMQLSAAVNGCWKAEDLSRAQFEVGKAGLLDVLDVERSLYSAEDTLIESQVAIAKDQVTLAKALGGGWDEPVDPNTPEVIDADMGPRRRASMANGE